MAFSLTAGGTTSADYSTGGNVGNSISPSENDIVVLVVNCNTATSFSAVTGFSATWAEILVNTSGDHNMHVWAARMGASPGTGQVNVTLPSSTTFCADVFIISGASTSGAVSTAFVQSVVQSQYNPSNPMSLPTLNAFASATNLTLLFGGDQNALTFTADTGFTILQQDLAGNDFHTCISYQAAEDTTTAITTSGGFDYKWISGIAFEIAEEAASDTTPDAFSFTDLTNQTISTQVTSNTITVTGIDASTPISISTTAGMEYNVNAGGWTSSSGNVVVNDQVQLRVTTSASYSTAVEGTLDIGGVTDTWTVTTQAAPPASLDDVNTDEIVVNAETGVTITVSNFGSDITSASITDGSNTSAFTSLSGTGDNYTATAPDITAIGTTPTAGAPYTSTNHSLSASVTDGSDSDTLGITFNPETGYAVVEVQMVVNDTGSVSENFSGTVPDTSQILYTTADATSVTAGGTPLTITGATQANPVVLSVTNSFSGGETVAVRNVTGMTEINDRLFTVANPTGSTIELEGEDGTGHTAYSSGGQVGLAGGLLQTDSTSSLTMHYWDATSGDWNSFIGYAVLNQVTSDFDVNWSILEKIFSDVDIISNIIERIVSDFDLLSNILERLSSDLNLSSDILEKILSDKVLSYDILERILSDFDVLSNILERITSDEDISYSILNRITSDESLVYNILEKITSDRTLSYSILEKIFSDIDVIADILNRITSDNDVIWNIATLDRIYQNQSVSWGILERILSDTDILYSILNRVSSDKTVNWALLSKIVSDKDFSYNILERVSSDKVIIYSILEKVLSSLVVNHDILNAVNSDLDVISNIIEKVTSDIYTLWDINDLQKVISEIDITWSLLSRTQEDLEIRYSIGETVINTPDSRTLNVPSVSRIIKIGIDGKIK